MSEQVSIARTARERLAAGLAALQDPGAPESLGMAAEPIAKAMSAMHRIERGDAARDTAADAVRLVREALAQLQASRETHPALDAAMENVAQSLSAVHALARAAAQPVAAVPEVSKTTPSPPLDPYSLSPQANIDARSAAPSPQAYIPVAHTAPVPAVSPSPQPAADPVGLGSTQPVTPIQVPAQIADAAIPLDRPAHPNSTQPIAKARTAPQVQLEASPKTEPRPAGGPSAAPAGPTHQQAAQQQQTPRETPAAAAAVNPVVVKESQPRALSETPEVGSNPSNPANRQSTYDVALGTNSNSNFYKGLSPGDLLEAGGLFIATYNIPDIGARVDLKVTMPGGYEFAAEGLVAWTRDTPPASNNANLSPPGFGVRLKLLSSEARALVHRYARNREPFFYDDI